METSNEIINIPKINMVVAAAFCEDVSQQQMLLD